MKAWLSDNWDKVLGVLTGIVISGVVGYFSGISATEEELTNAKLRILYLETQVADVIKPRLALMETNEVKIERVESSVKTLESRQDIAAETGNLLRLQIEEIRSQTLGTLKDLLAAGK